MVYCCSECLVITMMEVISESGGTKAYTQKLEDSTDKCEYCRGKAEWRVQSYKI